MKAASFSMSSVNWELASHISSIDPMWETISQYTLGVLSGTKASINRSFFVV